MLLPLWQRGSTLSQALAVLHGITEDPDAGRAERHDMIDAFDGLDRYIPRPVRAELISWQQQGFITISRIPLTDAPEETDLLAAPDMRWTFRGGRGQPAAACGAGGPGLCAGLDVELDDVGLAGQRLPTLRRRAGHRSDPRWWINWKWQGYRSIVYCVTGGDGRLEAVRPTRTRPLNTLVIRPGRTLYTQWPVREIRVREARAHLTELLAASADGEGTRITRHGRAVAVLLRPGAAAALSPDQRKHQRNRILQEP